jgi:hypothetical protein
MKTITLKELKWFSLTSSSDTQNNLTLWQAVAFILERIDGFEEDSLKFTDKMNILEKKFTESLIDDYEILTSLQDKDINGNDFYLENLKLPIREAMQELDSLNEFRKQHIDSLGMPYSMIYELLMSEIHQFKSNAKPTLKVVEKSYDSYKLYLFGKSELHQWKSISVLNQLGLSSDTLSNSRNGRGDKSENREIIMGMLIHLLARQPIKDKHGKDVQFFKGGTPTTDNINFSKIYNYFFKNHLNEELSNFPQQRTVTNSLSTAYRKFTDEVNTR